MYCEGKWVEVDKNGIGWNLHCYVSCKHTVYEQTRTDRVQIPIVINNFCCPICGNNEFEAIYEYKKEPGLGPITGHTVIGPDPTAGFPSVHSVRISEYRCPGCTTRFDDPTKFTKNKPAQIVPPQPTPTPMEMAKAEMAERWRVMKVEKSGGRDLHPDHRIRSLFMDQLLDKSGKSPEAENICDLCGATDEFGGAWGELANPCKASAEDRQAYDQSHERKAV